MLVKLNSSRQGLAQDEVRKRLKQVGLNQLPPRARRTRLNILLKQLKNPLVYFLFGATLIAGFLGEIVDATVIGLAIFISASFGFFQEYKSEKAIHELNKLVREVARALRGGEEQKIDATLLTPGDIIILQDGYKVPADARLLEAKNLEIDEAILTGESVPESKGTDVLLELTPLADRKNMIYTGTIVVRGRGLAVVVSTGLHTEVGKIAKSLGEIKRSPTPLEIKIGRLSKNLSVAILVALTCLFILGITFGIPGKEMLLTSIALVAAAVPEGLVVSVTAVLVIGMRRLAREKALVRNLGAVETVGQTTVICSDKTGTMTTGTMVLDKIVPKMKELNEQTLLRIGMLASDSRVENPQAAYADWRLTGDPTTRSLLQAALEAGLHKDYLSREKVIVDEVPFESDLGYRTILVSGNRYQGSDARNTLYFLGIPEKLIGKSALRETEKQALLNENISMSQSGFRVLGVATKEADISEKISEIPDYANSLQFLGFFALKDPLRESVKEAVAHAREAGVRVMMLTGDNKFTAAAIAKELNLPIGPNNLIDSFDAAKLSAADLDKQVRELTVFARVTPDNKLKIVESLERQGEVVAMTGDGVNDAPALHRAGVGIALGSGQAVSREAAHIVLLDDNFKTIVRGIEEGRGIFDNIRKVVAFLLYDSFIEVFMVAASILMRLPIPILPAQILWVNVVEDTFPAFALALEPKEPDVMKQKPLGFRGNIIDAKLKTIIICFGTTSALLLFSLFVFLLKMSVPLSQIRTIIFVGLTIDSLFLVFSLKSLRQPLWKIPLFNNKYLWAFFFGGLIFLLIPVYVPFFQNILRTVPLGPRSWALLLSLGFVNLIFLEIIKFIFIRRTKNI